MEKKEMKETSAQLVRAAVQAEAEWFNAELARIREDIDNLEGTMCRILQMFGSEPMSKEETSH